MAKGHDTLRDWSDQSYKPDGRAESSLSEPHRDPQIADASGKGHNGAPGVEALNKSGSADPGRRKWGGSMLPPDGKK